MHQGWGQIFLKQFKSKSFEIFQMQMLSFAKGFKSKTSLKKELNTNINVKILC